MCGFLDIHNLNIVHEDLECTNIVVKADANVAIIDIAEGGQTEEYYWPDDDGLELETKGMV